MQFDVTHYQTVTSTMDVARDLAERGAAEGTVAVADEQTAGRGRSNHTWYSPPGQSLYLSIILRPPLTPAQTGWITMLAALAVRDLLLRVEGWGLGVGDAGVGLGIVRNPQPPAPNPQPSITNYQLPITIKWFNDVLLNDRKVCGILVETSLTGERIDYAVLGIGLNVNTRFDGAPADVRARATSLFDECQRQDESTPPFDREAIMQRLLERFAERYARLMQTRASPAREYAQYVETLGRDVRIDTGQEIVAGRAVRIADDGALIVLTEAGERRIGFGDII
jgi:BirA family biotin operon repressor/biotin-[acetyl-CoA-carboxylase] ligase